MFLLMKLYTFFYSFYMTCFGEAFSQVSKWKYQLMWKYIFGTVFFFMRHYRNTDSEPMGEDC